MSKVIGIMGESGSGKTTSLRTLNPKETYYIDCDGKGLNWKGWREQYGKDKKNYTVTRDIQYIEQLIKNISDKAANIKTIVIDTLNTCMVDKEVQEMKVKGYDKWTDICQYVWNLISSAQTLRDDLTVIFVMHSESVRDDMGYNMIRMKTNGRKLEKLVPESLFNVVFLAKQNDKDEYVFYTRLKDSTVKTPMGAFAEQEIPNDMGAVLKALSDY